MATATKGKSVVIPAAGDYFTDGAQLVEITGKIRTGYTACNVLVLPEHCQDVAQTLLTVSDVNGGAWRLVRPS